MYPILKIELITDGYIIMMINAMRPMIPKLANHIYYSFKKISNKIINPKLLSIKMSIKYNLFEISVDKFIQPTFGYL